MPSRAGAGAAGQTAAAFGQRLLDRQVEQLRAVSTDDPIASSVPPFSTNARSFFQPSSPTPNAHDHSAGSLRFGSRPLTMRAFDVLDGSRMTSYFALRSPVKSCDFTIS